MRIVAAAVVVLAAGLAAGLTGCASRPAPVLPPPVAATVPPVRPPLPEGAYPGMAIPMRLPDGRWPTPNLVLSDAAAIWHLRGALNVAALACRSGGDALVTPYNSWITTRKATLAAAEARYAAEWRAGGTDWRDRYDDAMTRLYNFYGQPGPRAGYCAAAGQMLAAVAAVDDAGLAVFARSALGLLDRPFIDFYAAFDAWRTGEAPAAPGMAVTAPAGRPRLEVDPAIFRME